MTEIKGLLPEHHGELNKDISADRIAELRLLYATDPLALFDIDQYDITSEVGRNELAYRDALLAKNYELAAELKSWLVSRNPRTTNNVS